jgi:HPt (histidine-containing phosphotransfer) domain-containing protein
MPSALDPEVWASLESLESAGAPGFLRELVNEFLARAPERLQRVRAAAASGDAPALEREAHAFKGSCGSLGASAMAASCGQLESLGRGGSCSGHAEVIAGLERHWQAVRGELLRALSRMA